MNGRKTPESSGNTAVVAKPVSDTMLRWYSQSFSRRRAVLSEGAVPQPTLPASPAASPSPASTPAPASIGVPPETVNAPPEPVDVPPEPPSPPDPAVKAPPVLVTDGTPPTPAEPPESSGEPFVL